MKKKGFTLIELLAVIVILAVISFISIPIVLSMIEKARKSAFLDSAYGLMKSAESEYIETILENKELPTLFEYPFDNLKFSGAKPQGGKIVIDEKGNIGIAIHNNKWCAKKEITEKNVIILKYESETCTISNVPDLPKPPDLITIEEQMKKQSDEVATLDPDHNLRYVGGNPKNYVKFNNELWRIIGVFDGQAKIIRRESYNAKIAWDTNNKNDWSQASLQKELNETYLSSIDEESKSYIDQSHVWNLGGHQSKAISSWTREGLYYSERGTNVYSGPAVWNGAIGLLYPSDYGYATDGDHCDTTMDTWDDVGTGNKTCYSASNNWISSLPATTDSWTWTLTPRSDNAVCVFEYHTKGSVSGFNGSGSLYEAKPVLYLKSSVKIKAGEGTVEKPYELDT